jgi:hypothetical protein
VGNFFGETFNNLPTAWSLRLLNTNINNKLEENLSEFEALIRETFNFNQENLKLTLDNIIAELNSVKNHNVTVSQ